MFMPENGKPPGLALSALVLLGFLLIVFGVAGAGAWITQGGLSDWYVNLEKPALTPPNIVFPIVWNILYLLMALAAWLVWRSAGSFRAAAAPLVIFFVQLGLNFSWSALFFGLENPGAALFEIIVLLFTILLTLVLFWRISRPAGLMILPYFLWVAFATYLNAAIWLLNSRA